MGNLTFDGVTKRFRDGSDTVVAVNDLSMEIEDGELLVIVGPSGCGKTTTLRMIAGLETISEGEIYLNDDPMSGTRPQDRNIAMVFQSYALYPHMTVRENMSFGLQQSTDLPDAEIDDRVDEIGELLDIPELLDRYPGDLSGGQQQRVALGRAIIRDPEVFLMDEPLSNLDAKLRAQMRTELQRLQERLDTTTVYVTHDQTEAMTMGDRIAILDGGELQQIGTPMECYDRPANRFVAGFIGEPQMNFFEVEAAGGRIRAQGFDHQLDDAIAAKLDDGPVTLGIRPEDVTVTPPEGRAVEVETTVDVIEPLGSENNVYFRMGESDGGAVDASDDFVGVVDEDQPIDGPETTVYFPEDLIHLFDAGTGTAIHNQTREAVDQQAAWPT